MNLRRCGINLSVQVAVKRLLPAVVAIVMPVACNVARYVPEGQYLLDKISIESDSGFVPHADFLAFVRQKPNDPKLGLLIYNMVNNDPSKFNKIIRKTGDPPVIFSQSMLDRSLNEIAVEMNNRGYLNARVHARLDTSGKKISVAYHIHEGAPHRIRNYEIRMPNARMDSIAAGIRATRTGAGTDSVSKQQNTARQPTRFTFPMTRRRTFLRKGAVFSMPLLERERNRVSNRLRNSGYYRSSVDNLHYIADTSLYAGEVSLTLAMKDTVQADVYRTGKVKVFSGYDFMRSDEYAVRDSATQNGIHIYYGEIKFLRPRVIADKVRVRPGRLFRERDVSATLNLLRTMNSVGQADLRFVEGNYADPTLIDCEIYIAPGNTHATQASLSGTNKAGDLGLSAEIHYENQNLFNGSEQFQLRLNGAYELVNERTGDALGNDFYEFGIAPSLNFSAVHLPFIGNYIKDRYNSRTEYGLGFNIQKRPQYARNYFSLNWQFQWSGRSNIVTHAVNLVNINYVAMPWQSDLFRDYLNNRVDSLTRYSYENIFTAGSGYRLIYTGAERSRRRQRLYTLRFNVESSGNVLNGILSLSDRHEKSENSRTIFGNPFAQYLKGEVDYSETVRLSENGAAAFHMAAGVAYPYGNSAIMPFEKRYYAGGPNNVRGWQTRYLGPGSLSRRGANSMVFHVGDIHLILSAEYRYKLLGWLEPALFVDCGNIWTVRDYPNQPGGLFRWSTFYRELAAGAGIGLRFDLSFLILRIDAGTRIHDPAMPSGRRFVFLKNGFQSNSAIYAAIGYPF
jgi:outer membrane protein assembly factor BamA